MNLNNVLAYENIKQNKVGKKARAVATVCVFTIALMFSAMYLLTNLLSIYLPSSVRSNAVLMYLVEGALYIGYIVIPFGIACLLLNSINKNTEIFQPKRTAPKYGALFVIGTIGVGYIINIIVYLLFPNFFEYFTSGGSVSANSPLEIALFFITTAVLPAIIEEWAFRGVLLKNLLPYGRGGAIVISALLFGIAHVDPPRIIFATCIGLLLGLCYEYTGSLLVPIIIHFINNSIAVVASLVSTDSIFMLLLGLMIFAIISVGIAAIIVYSITGIKKQRISLAKPDNVGYTLSVGKYVSRMFLNFAFIPLLLIYSVLLIVLYFPDAFNGVL